MKADQDSEAMRRLQVCTTAATQTRSLSHVVLSMDVLALQIAGNAVKKASDNLVRAAQKAAFDKADEDNVVVKTKFVGGIAQVRTEEGQKVLQSFGHFY